METTSYQQAQDNLRTLFILLVYFPANVSLNKNVVESSNPDADSLTGAYIVSGDKELLNEYFNTLLQYIRLTVTHRNMLRALKEKADSVIEFFKKKYGWD